MRSKAYGVGHMAHGRYHARNYGAKLRGFCAIGAYKPVKDLYKRPQWGAFGLHNGGFRTGKRKRKRCALVVGQFASTGDNKRNCGRKLAILLTFCGRFGRFSS